MRQVDEILISLGTELAITADQLIASAEARGKSRDQI
jgi:hypothetical protein